MPEKLEFATHGVRGKLNSLKRTIAKGSVNNARDLVKIQSLLIRIRVYESVVIRNFQDMIRTLTSRSDQFGLVGILPASLSKGSGFAPRLMFFISICYFWNSNLKKQHQHPTRCFVPPSPPPPIVKVPKASVWWRQTFWSIMFVYK